MSFFLILQSAPIKMKTFLPTLLLVAATMSFGQGAKSRSPMRYLEAKEATVCYFDTRIANTLIEAPEEYRKLKQAGARTKSANIKVTYAGFTAEAQAAFQAAVNIWESLIQTDVTINIQANWAPLAAGVLGSAGPGGYVQNFDGAQKNDIWYPVALAEKMARKELNSASAPDISVTFSSAHNWHYGLDSDPPPAGKHDLMTVVMHEIGHGLGLTHAYSVNLTQGVITSFFNGKPISYETHLESSDNKVLVTSFEAPSDALGTVLISENLFYNSPLALAANNNERVRIYAPAAYSAGSSIAHLNEVTYPAGSVNSLMTPTLSSAERILDAGPIFKAILKDMGWVTTYIQHTSLIGTENVSLPYDIVAKVTTDNGFNASTLALNYSTDGSAFTTVAMLPTGTANEFKASIPVGQTKYHYFISVKDNDGRTITKPGTKYKQGSPTSQSVITFEVGPDNKKPVINHVPVKFMATHDTLRIQAIISDNLGLQEATLEWKVKGFTMSDQQLQLQEGTDSTYAIGLIFPEGTFVSGDKIHYRIKAKDKAIAGNTTYAPSETGFYEVNVTGLSTAQTEYFNNFNNLSDADFFGTGFSITTPSGFSNGAIHTMHPYPEAGAGSELNFTYQLKVPIILKAQDAVLKFDEVVLVEPGEPGAPFGSDNFFDYVVVEGSKDGGITWTPVADGHNSRDKSEWLTHYNSNLTGQISNAQGTPELYRTRTYNLLTKFQANDVVAFRFRFFSDPFAAGWGWAIDNLSIQLDSKAPEILHQHSDYIMAGATQFALAAKITDNVGLDKVVIEHKINNGSVVTAQLIIDQTTDLYNASIPFGALAAGDILHYRIRAMDAVGNEVVYPSSDFFKVAALSLASPADHFAADFTQPSTGISGNFFTMGTADGFQNGAIHSPHPYKASLGVDPSSTTYSFYITTPIRVSATNPHIVFDEVVLTEYSGSNPVDYVTMEASKDGLVWEKLLADHAANFNTAWKTAYDFGGSGTSTMFQKRFFPITESGKFKANDVVLVRFRLFSNQTTTGWGFAIDNLSIQGPYTGVEDRSLEFSLYPNPVAGDEIHVRLSTSSAEVATSVMSAHGQLLSTARQAPQNGILETSVPVGDLPAGLYLLRLETDEGVSIKKFVRTR
jgi:hypothetical protein